MTRVTTIPVDDDVTVDALDEMPDDGQRYELLDGLLLVSPAPRPLHQVVVVHLLVLLRAAVPDDCRVLVAPVDVRLSDRRQVQPDLLVVRDLDVDAARLDGPPLLAVEVESPGSRRQDRVLKRRAYEASGVPHHWILDPDGPTLTSLELVDGAYREVAVVRGGVPWTAQRPFPVTVLPEGLVR